MGKQNKMNGKGGNETRRSDRSILPAQQQSTNSYSDTEALEG